MCGLGQGGVLEQLGLGIASLVVVVGILLEVELYPCCMEGSTARSLVRVGVLVVLVEHVGCSRRS